ncbi:MAG: fibrobacter succinogenes major paralogous domain-containing protein [bacterium]|nr:fibrobacter succinogenes major paralogous domain-containing protein [bacterium]
MKSVYLIVVSGLFFWGCVREPIKTEVIVPMTDKGGNTYKTIKIDKQEWMAENLNVSCYRNGDSIPQVQDAEKWKNLTTGAWCYYKNNAEHEKTYGKLYNWYAVNDPRGLAPEGWHIPSDSGWAILADCLGGKDIAGGKLKESDTTHWTSPNVGATNETGFSALPGSARSPDGSFGCMGHSGGWWSTTEFDTTSAWCHPMSYHDTSVHRNSYDKRCALSIRCVRD